MSKIAVIPTFEQPQVCGDFLAKLLWFLAPASDSISAISLHAGFGALPQEVPKKLDPNILTSEASRAFL